MPQLNEVLETHTILQPRKQEIVHHLILPGYRLYKFRMCIDICSIRRSAYFAHLKEICLFLRRCHLTPAVRAFSIHQLGFREKGSSHGVQYIPS